jgi:hypothetical protein
MVQVASARWPIHQHPRTVRRWKSGLARFDHEGFTDGHWLQLVTRQIEPHKLLLAALSDKGE